jgi:hypothetical protein
MKLAVSVRSRRGGGIEARSGIEHPEAPPVAVERWRATAGLAQPARAELGGLGGRGRGHRQQDQDRQRAPHSGILEREGTLIGDPETRCPDGSVADG